MRNELDNSDIRIYTDDDYEEEETPLDLAMVATPIKYYYIPMIATMIIAIVITIPVHFLDIKVEGMPFSEETGGAGAAFLNVMFFMVFFLSATILMLMLIKKRKDLWLKAILALSLLMGAVSLGLFYGSVIGYIFYLAFPVELLYWLVFGVFIAVDVLMVFMATKGIYRSPALVFLSAQLGAFLGVSLGTLTIVLLLTVLAIYDFYSVFRGPLKKIIEEVFETGDASEETPRKHVRIGLGDLVFLSAFPAHIARFYTITASLLSLGAIGIGMVITMHFVLKKKKAMPGLPLSVLLGLLTFAICLIIKI